MKVILEIESCATCPFVDLRERSDKPLLPDCVISRPGINHGLSPGEPFAHVPADCPLKTGGFNCTRAGKGVGTSIAKVVVLESLTINYKPGEVER